MVENSYEQLDDLFVQIRLCLASMRQSNPEATEELKGLLRQVELWVESLVIDSLKLKSLESKPKRATAPERKPPEKTNRK